MSGVHLLRRTSDSKRKTAYRSRSDTCYQRYDPEIPHNEGYKVPRKAGWDTHGLPVELEVEKLLGLDGKDQIEGYGLSRLSTNVKRAYGNTKECGRISPARLDSGQIWSILM